MSAPLPAIAAGHICLDILPEMGGLPAGSFDSQFQPGRLLEVGQATLCTGGPVSNVGLALHRLGVPTRLICKTGADDFGQVIRKLVSRIEPRLAEGILTAAGEDTSYSIIISPPGKDRLFLHNPGANRTFGAGDVNYGLVSEAALFHFGYPPVMRRIYSNGGRELTEMLRGARQAGATTSLDMCSLDPTSEGGQADWGAILRGALPEVDIYMPSLEETLQMLRRPLYEHPGDCQPWAALVSELGAELLGMGAGMVGLKLGACGLYLRTAPAARLAAMGRGAPADPAAWADLELWAPCFKVQVAGTTGAGDATIAGFLSALLRGLGPEQALTAAVAVGACNVEAADALSGLRSWEETQARLAAPWERLMFQQSPPGWTWEERFGMWRKTK
jgi:sugar/nucleoside kinase (ribokinase family)